MKRFNLAFFLFFLFSVFLLPQPAFALLGCDPGDGEEGAPCCYKFTSMETNEPYCNGNNICETDPAAWLANPDDPNASECVSVSCGGLNQPCCGDRICNSDSLECHDALIEGYAYNTICSLKTANSAASPVFCIPGDESSGISTALGCIKTSSSGSGLVELILRFATGIGGGLALALILYGVFIVTTSAGSPDKLNQGKEIITSAIVGLIFILLSVFLVNLIGINILGIPGLT